MESHFQVLLDKAIGFDCKPSISRVYVAAADNYAGYQATAEFRRGHASSTCRSIQYTGDTPEEAMFNLLAGLQHFAPCPSCGAYPPEERESQSCLGERNRSQTGETSR